MNWYGRRPQPLPAGVLAGWLRAGFETGMLSDGPYPVRQRPRAWGWAEWRGWSALGAALFLLTTGALSTWAIWGGR